MEKALECFTKKYADFSGRASRSEYWFFILFFTIGFLMLVLIDFFMGTYNNKMHMGLLSSVFYLAVIIPYLSVKVRRLHDVDKSGWWLLINLIPIIGGIWLFILYCTKGTDGENRFGSDPLQV